MKELKHFCDVKDEEEQVAECIKFAAKKALIFHQKNYSLTQMLDCEGCKSCKNLETTTYDKYIATYHAKGFGIEEKDITYIEDMTIDEINEIT